jgi:hypothetical protein
MDQLREVMRLKHYSIRTERCYCDWIRRYVKFHAMRRREELLEGAAGKMELFLSDLAVRGQVAASTQNQAFNALLFLYREVLHQPVGGVDAVRADRPLRVPVVLTVGEARSVILGMSGTPQLVAKLLYGSGLRLLEKTCQSRQFAVFHYGLNRGQCATMLDSCNPCHPHRSPLFQARFQVPPARRVVRGVLRPHERSPPAGPHSSSRGRWPSDTALSISSPCPAFHASTQKGQSHTATPFRSNLRVQIVGTDTFSGNASRR